MWSDAGCESEGPFISPMKVRSELFGRVACSILAAAILVMAPMGGAGAGEVDDAESGWQRHITLRLTLRGPVVPTDVFSMGMSFVDPTSPSDLDMVQGSLGIVCGPPRYFYPDPAAVEPCAEGAYQAVVEVPITDAVEISFARDRDNSDGSEDGWEVLYETVLPATATPQTANLGDRSPRSFTVVFDYELPLLPNTALAIGGH
jgi:hypothetical protein